MKKIILFLITCVLILAIKTKGQDAHATISTVNSCPESQVTVALNVENFNNIAAMTLYIGYDTAQLTFVTVQNIHPVFQGLIYNNMMVPAPQIGISFTSINGVTLLSGKLFDMVFTFKSNTSILSFNPGCDIIDPDFEEIPVTYVSGGVFPIISILNQPQSVTVTAPEPAAFSVLTTGGNSFQWQRSTNSGITFTDLTNTALYQGVNTKTLQITSTNQLINGSFYRCKIISGDCIVYSDHGVLMVVNLVHQQFILSAGWNSLATYLNPTDTDPEVLFAPILNDLQIVISGDKVFNPSAGVNTLGTFDPKLGYAIKMSNGNSFTISGTPIVNQNLTINTGWSYLPVFTNCDADIVTLFGEEINEVEIIMELPGLNMFWPEFGITSLSALTMGKSYKIKMKSMIEITAPSCN